MMALTKISGDVIQPNISVSGIITATSVNSTILDTTTITGVSTAGITTAYINTLSGISTIDASAAVSINQNLVFASGKGIDFSATANSSGTMSSELLSDYEEGTWTPTITGGSTAGTGTYSQQYGSYTKIGRTVTLTGYIAWGAHTGTGTFYISNLPFITGYENSFDNITTGSIMLDSITFSGYPVVYSVYNTSYLTIYVSNNSSGWFPINIDTSGSIIFGITYITP